VTESRVLTFSQVGPKRKSNSAPAPSGARLTR